MTKEREALKLALSALKEALTTDDSVVRFRAYERAKGYVEAVLALEQEQEPVAWSVTVGKDYKNCIEITHCKSDALAQYEELTKGGFESIYTLHQLYTTPPKREWVGLTVEQIEDVGFNLLPTVAQKDFVAFARYVEMLSKEKNQ